MVTSVLFIIGLKNITLVFQQFHQSYAINLNYVKDLAEISSNGHKCGLLTISVQLESAIRLDVTPTYLRPVKEKLIKLNLLKK